MAIQLKNDVSYLFSNVNNSGNSYGMNSMYSLLGDYSTIKSGSYGKLMKAYFSMDADEEVKSLAQKNESKVKEDEKSKAVATAQTKVDSLDSAVDKLYTKEEDSVWAKKDMDEVYGAVNSFVKGYNEALESVSELDSKTVNNRGLTLINNTEMYKDDLAKIGITINDDDTLSIDKKTFSAAGVDKVAEVFQGRGSYGHIQSTQVDLLKSAVDYEAVSASTYNSSATYNTLGSSGTLFDSLF